MGDRQNLSKYPAIIRRNTDTVSQISLKRKLLLLRFVTIAPRSPHPSPFPTQSKYQNPVTYRCDLYLILKWLKSMTGKAFGWFHHSFLIIHWSTLQAPKTPMAQEVVCFVRCIGWRSHLWHIGSIASPARTIAPQCGPPAQSASPLDRNLL